jgi:hypothetical protein
MSKFPVKALVVAGVQVIFFVAVGLYWAGVGWSNLTSGVFEYAFSAFIFTTVPGLFMTGYGLALLVAVTRDILNARKPLDG